jgi:hypothetical protein
MPGAAFSPKPFDVVFTRGKELSALVSVLIQPLGDDVARGADRTFSHVSVVINDSYALEAVPIDDEPEIGSFSGSELHAGVRIIPVLDLVMPQRTAGAQTAVFRSHRAASVPKGEFDLRSKAILELFASEYSLEGLRDAIETKLRLVPEGIKEWLREKYNWTSPRQNVGALVDEEVRLSLEKVIPGYKFPFKNSKYFCSKLVAELLERSQLYHFDSDPETVSPTGLYARLAKSTEWVEITDLDYAADVVNKAANSSSRASVRFGHWLTLEEIVLTLRQMGVTSVVDLLAAGTKKVEEDLKGVHELVEGLGLGDSRRKLARDREADFVNTFVEIANISDEEERERFGGRLGTTLGCLDGARWTTTTS